MSSTHNTGNEENVQPTLRERTLTDVGRRTILLRFPPEFRALTATAPMLFLDEESGGEGDENSHPWYDLASFRVQYQPLPPPGSKLTMTASQVT